jgi:hypothetical protein
VQEYRRDEGDRDAAEPTELVGIRTEHPFIGGLSLSARGLLLSLLFDGLDLQPMKEMDAMGITKKKTLHDARKELEVAGWISVTRLPGKPPIIQLQHFPSTANVTQPPKEPDDIPSTLLIDIYNICDGTSQTELMDTGRSSSTEMESTPLQGSYLERVYPLQVATLEGVTHSGSSPEGSYLEGSHPKVLPTLLARCEEVDGMDSSGEERSRTSPFQTRRREQLNLMDELIEKFLPGVDIGAADRKRLLNWCDNSLETLYEELEYVSSAIQKKGGIDYPRGYALKTVEARSKSRVLSSSARPVQPTVLYGAAAYREGEPLPDPEPEWLADSLEKGRLAMERYIAERGLLE